MIKGIVSGVDNFLVEKDVSIEEQDMTNLKSVISDLRNRNIKFSLITGRSLEKTEELIKYLDVSDICGFEMGLHLYDPLTQESFDLTDYHREMREAKYALDLTRDSLLYHMNMIQELLGEELHYLSDRKRIITFETKSKSGSDLYQILSDIMPSIASKLISKRRILMFPSSKAVDIMPNLTKGDASLFIASKYELNPDELLACSVSYHTDHEMLKNCGYASTTENADNVCKLYIRKEKGSKGYISPFSYTKGAVDSISHFIEL